MHWKWHKWPFQYFLLTQCQHASCWLDWPGQAKKYNECILGYHLNKNRVSIDKCQVLLIFSYFLLPRKYAENMPFRLENKTNI